MILYLSILYLITVGSRIQSTPVLSLDHSMGFTDTITPPPVYKIDTLLKISFGPCYGNCPVYDLTIFNDGTAIWNGLKNTALNGPYVARLSRVQSMELEKLAFSDALWTGPDFYPNPKSFIYDFPLHKLLIRNKEKSKYIINNHSPSPDLKKLEERISSLVDQLDWRSIAN